MSTSLCFHTFGCNCNAGVRASDLAAPAPLANTEPDKSAQLQDQFRDNLGHVRLVRKDGTTVSVEALITTETTRLGCSHDQKQPTAKGHEAGNLSDDEFTEAYTRWYTFQDSFYNWLLLSGVDLWVKSSEMTSSKMTDTITGEIDMSKLKASIMQLVRYATGIDLAMRSLIQAEATQSRTGEHQKGDL